MFIEVTYKVHSEQAIDPEKKAKSIALGQTTDTWMPNARSGLKKLEKHRGVVLEAIPHPIQPAPSPLLPLPRGERAGRRRRASPKAGVRVKGEGCSYQYLIRIGFPPSNTEGDIPSLLTMIFGKISLDGKIRLEDIQFPPSYLKGKGPEYGIEGIRKKVQEADKPLTMAIFKPCLGLAPKELGEMFFELACGGMHLVKDDEILPDLPLCPVEKRLEACLRAADKAKEITRRPTLYAVNITGPVSGLAAKARRLARQGAECFLLNVLSYGYGALEELRSVGVPIMAHPALAGGLCASMTNGISYRVVLGSLMRLGGADIVLFPSSYGTVALPETETQAITEALIAPHPAPSPRGRGSKGEGMRRSFPGPSAGIHPGLVPRLLQDYGREVIINAGGGVHGHPQGARAGALAFEQAVERALRRQDFGAVTEKEAPELAKALAQWGHPHPNPLPLRERERHATVARQSCGQPGQAARV